MGRVERQSLFKCYWAAGMMPKRSSCFRSDAFGFVVNWMSREAVDDPRFSTGLWEGGARALLAGVAWHRYLVNSCGVSEPVGEVHYAALAILSAEISADRC